MKILLVDDDKSVLHMLSKWLKLHGYEVHKFDNSEELLNYFLCHKKAYDILITDIEMPDMDGFDLARKVCHECSRMKIIFMSGNLSYSEGSIKDLSCCEHYFFHKPVPLNQLDNLLVEISPE